MGWRYLSFRLQYELKRKLNLLYLTFPMKPHFHEFITLQKWKEQASKFFFDSKESITIKKSPTLALEVQYDNIKLGKFLFFSSIYFDLPKNYDWVTNPATNHRYDSSKHWSKVSDYSKKGGDIKFVWEKSRFSYIYDVIRYDYHHSVDCSEFVMSEILSWIKHNPVNCGPNYRCSQEISIRLLNWTFALYYYKNSPYLSTLAFKDIQYAIYWQVHHIYKNIKFSKTAVRNNHALTETLTLYLMGFFFPSIKDFQKWSIKGKQWFEQEITYQVYEDGTFLQYSMNYHRIVIQLLTWGIRLSELNGQTLTKSVYDRARKSVAFLWNCINEESGYLPNYGANDGALFFPLNNNEYRDFRPQLQALGDLLQAGLFKQQFEDSYWYGNTHSLISSNSRPNGVFSYPVSGYYLIKEDNAFTFIRCGNHRNRPSQADNLHIDIWHNGENIMRDGGSYKYNASNNDIKYFFGSQSHNTVMLEDYDQMEKGGRFIWHNWTHSTFANLEEKPDRFEFTGEISAFQHVDTKIKHKRTVVKYKNIAKWLIVDEIENLNGLTMNQIWNPTSSLNANINLTSFDTTGKPLTAATKQGWYSSKYGSKEEASQVIFSTKENTITTTIEILKNQ